MALNLLEVAYRLRVLGRFVPESKGLPTKVMGLTFPNPVGLAAGFDKNGKHINSLFALGFGFIEIGTVTPRPQAGIPRPRMFRIPAAEALINRMGFNNEGVQEVAKNIRCAEPQGVLGISIGKNADTPMEEAANDYVLAMQRIYGEADYIAVNVSSPGTEGLRTLEGPEELSNLLSVLKAEQERLAGEYRKRVPLVVKVSPDIAVHTIYQVAETLLEHEVDGLIATNTTLSRDDVTDLTHAAEAGGLSGTPLNSKALHVLKMFEEVLQGRIPIIASGGIMSPEDALERLRSGASLVQLYSGLVFQGMKLISETVQAVIDQRNEEDIAA